MATALRLRKFQTQKKMLKKDHVFRGQEPKFGGPGQNFGGLPEFQKFFEKRWPLRCHMVSFCKMFSGPKDHLKDNR